MLYAEPEIVPLIPEFMKADPEASRADPAGDQEKGLTGASRGSAYHKILELLDFTQNYDESGVNLAVETFLEKGRITEDMAESIRADDILHFLNCESGQRMMEAAKRGRLFREQPFVISMDASAFYPDDCSGEKILVQGIIDVYFEEEDGLVVLDYKTDRVRHAAELKEKYHAQLDYYADALRRLTGKTCEREDYLFIYTERGDQSMRILLFYLILINLVTFVIYGADKWKAKAGKRRVPEKTLLVLTLIGGSVGALFAMLLFRHKTRETEVRHKRSCSSRRPLRSCGCGGMVLAGRLKKSGKTETFLIR